MNNQWFKRNEFKTKKSLIWIYGALDDSSFLVIIGDFSSRYIVTKIFFSFEDLNNWIKEQNDDL